MKSINTKLKKYNNKNYNNIEKHKKTCLEKYGVEYISQSEEIQKKKILSGYRIKKYKYLYYQGTYELDFLENFYDKIEIKNIKSIKYDYNDKKRIYFPDFYLPEYNLIIEIKSNYIYNLHKERNECKRLGTLENGYNFIFIIDKDYTEFIQKFKPISYHQ